MLGEPSISTYYSKLCKKLIDEIRSLDEKYILGVDTDELVQYMAEKYALPKIEFDDETKPETKQISSEIVSPFVKSVHYKISMPIRNPNAPHLSEVLQRFGQKFGATPSPNIPLEENSLVLELSNISGSEEHLAKQIKSRINGLKGEVENRNSTIEFEDSELPRKLRQVVEDLKKRYSEERDILEGAIAKISIPLRISNGERKPMIDFSVKRAVKPVRRELPKVKYEPQLVLEREQLEAILGVIQNGCLSFEQTPSTFAKLPEEELRNVILGNLNGVIEGKATGETFNKRGKTDIYLVLDEGGIFVAECKFWSGAKAYSETIDQLFGYLTWRETYGTIVVFSRNQSLTSVIEAAQEAALNHNSCLSRKDDMQTPSNSHFITQHAHPDNNKKRVEVHHLFFNLYIKKG